MVIYSDILCTQRSSYRVTPSRFLRLPKPSSRSTSKVTDRIRPPDLYESLLPNYEILEENKISRGLPKAVTWKAIKNDQQTQPTYQDLHLVNVVSIPTGPTHGEGRLQPHPEDALKSVPNVRKSPRSDLNLEGRLSDPQISEYHHTKHDDQWKTDLVTIK